MPLALDVEEGLFTPEALGDWNFTESRLASASNYLAGLLVFLFLAGILPLSILFLTSVLLVCLSTCIRAHVEHRVNRNLNNSQGLNSFREVIQTLTRGASAGQSISLTSLQLSLVQRDFDAGDYDALLALDLEVGRRKQEQVSDEHLKRLTAFKHQRKEQCHRNNFGTNSTCCVCLDGFEEEAIVTKLACRHSFHSKCIHPWLRQQGLSALCPLCKAEVWPGKARALQKCTNNAASLDVREEQSLAIAV